MSRDYVDILREQTNGGATRLAELLREADGRLALALAQVDEATGNELVEQFMANARRKAPAFVRVPTPPEILAEFEATFDEDAVLAELEEVRRTGGFTLADILADIETVRHEQ